MEKGITFPVNSAVHVQLLARLHVKRPFSKTYHNKHLLLLTLKRFVRLVSYTFQNIIVFFVSIMALALFAWAINQWGPDGMTFELD